MFESAAGASARRESSARTPLVLLRIKPVGRSIAVPRGRPRRACARARRRSRRRWFL